MHEQAEPLDLDAIRACCEAASPGEWRREGVSVVTDRANICVTCDGGTSAGEQQANAAFIAHAHQDVPALLAEVERLRGQAGKSPHRNPLTG